MLHALSTLLLLVATAPELLVKGDQVPADTVAPVVFAPAAPTVPSPWSPSFLSWGEPCYLCGVPNFAEVDYGKTLYIEKWGETPCYVLADPYVLAYGYIGGGDITCPDVQAFAQDCGCKTFEPTISPSPTLSPKPTLHPSTSPSPTAAPCYMCGVENAWASIYYEKQVEIPGYINGVYCYEIQVTGMYGGFENITCDEIQGYAQECGCPPTEPTMSPGPTTSPKPTLFPTSSPSPTASPCYLCGVENPWGPFDYEKEVDFPALGGSVYCYYLNDLAYFGDFENATCAEIQGYARECGCPATEPTVSPAPTITEQPTSPPSSSPAPTAPCSCEGYCNGPNSDCGCWCDFVCTSFGDCCGDVNDFCVFEESNPGPGEENQFFN